MIPKKYRKRKGLDIPYTYPYTRLDIPYTFFTAFHSFFTLQPGLGVFFFFFFIFFFGLGFFGFFPFLSDEPLHKFNANFRAATSRVSSLPRSLSDERGERGEQEE